MKGFNNQRIIITLDKAFDWFEFRGRKFRSFQFGIYCDFIESCGYLIY
jgi:hypothetical protein